MARWRDGEMASLAQRFRETALETRCGGSRTSLDDTSVPGLDEFGKTLTETRSDLEAVMARAIEMETFYHEKLEVPGDDVNSSWCAPKLQHSTPSVPGLDEFGKTLTETRSALQSATTRAIEMETFYHEKLKVPGRFLNRLAGMDENYKEQLKKERFAGMDENYKKELHKERSARKKLQEELQSFKDRFGGMDEYYKKELHKERSARKAKEEELQSFKDRFAGMDENYKKELHKERSARKKLQEELQSFKDRVAEEVSASIKTGNTESMNSPVSKTRLTEMYEDLRVYKWPDIKDQLRERGAEPEIITAHIQDAFKDAAAEMEKKKKLIDEVVGLIERGGGLPAQKVKEYRGLAVLGLQMDLYNSLSGVTSQEVQYSQAQDVKEIVRHLLSECYWLGRLMALNNPPLQPYWENHTGMDWDIFPREIRASAAKGTHCSSL